ncbi:PAS domain-containing protein [Sinorhizobium saheli]|nr:PAS domain-containing protein [Sinorhizobium saheli]MQW87294.1 PAS domain-containing protein [Sinorhizobium saheli]
MRSRTTTELFQYWNATRGDRDLPRRDEIQPADIRTLLPELFILQRQADGTIRFRLAGTHVCALFGQELRDQLFSALWVAGEAGLAARIADHVMARRTPMLLSALGTTGDGDRLDIELLLAPLASPDGKGDRVLGALSPLSRPPWLHMTPLAHLVAQDLRQLEVGKPGPAPLFRPTIGGADNRGPAIDAQHPRGRLEGAGRD